MLSSQNSDYIFQLLEFINNYVEMYYLHNNCAHGFNLEIVAEILKYAISYYNDTYADMFINFIHNILTILILNLEDRLKLFVE